MADANKKGEYVVPDRRVAKDDLNEWKTYEESFLGRTSDTTKQGGIDIIFWCRGVACGRVERFTEDGSAYGTDAYGWRTGPVPSIEEAKKIVEAHVAKQFAANSAA